MTGPSQGNGRTTRRLAFALAIVVLLLIAFVLTVQDDQMTFRQQLSAIGLNLMASVVFALIFTTVSTRLQERLLQEASDERFRQFSSQLTQEVRSRFDDLSSQLRHQLAVTNTQYFPIKTYQAADDAREDFNRDVSASLRTTGIYAFRGTSAKYVAARVRAARRPLQELKVITLDPGSERVLRPRAADRSRILANRGKSVERLVNEIQDEILMSMVALFDCRHICSIEVTFAAETAVTRADLFDDAIYLSWYHSPESTTQIFPEAFRFQADSFLYKTQRSEMFRRFEVAEQGRNKFEFDASQDDGELIAILERTMRRTIPRSELATWRQSYEEFSAPFVDRLEHL